MDLKTVRTVHLKADDGGTGRRGNRRREGEGNGCNTNFHGEIPNWLTFRRR
jgi:hypothetical protein